MANTKMSDLNTLAEKVDVYKQQEDFFKVEQIEIILSRLEVLEQSIKMIQVSIVPIIEKLDNFLESIQPEPEVIEDDLPSEALIPPLPEPEPLPVAEVDPIANVWKKVLSDKLPIKLDLSLAEGNPKPAGNFTVGFDPAGAPDFVPPEPEPEHMTYSDYRVKKTELADLEAKIAAVKAELGEDIE